MARGGSGRDHDQLRHDQRFLPPNSCISPTVWYDGARPSKYGGTTEEGRLITSMTTLIMTQEEYEAAAEAASEAAIAAYDDNDSGGAYNYAEPQSYPNPPAAPKNRGGRPKKGGGGDNSKEDQATINQECMGVLRAALEEYGGRDATYSSFLQYVPLERLKSVLRITGDADNPQYWIKEEYGISYAPALNEKVAAIHVRDRICRGNFINDITLDGINVNSAIATLSAAKVRVNPVFKLVARVLTTWAGYAVSTSNPTGLACLSDLTVSDEEYRYSRRLMPTTAGVFNRQTSQWVVGYTGFVQGPTLRASEGPTPTWDSYMQLITGGDQELIDAHMDLLGDETLGFGMKLITLHLGPTNAMKSTRLRMIQKMIGSHSAQLNPECFKQDGDADKLPQQYALADGAWNIQFTGEVGEGSRFDASLLTGITAGGDTKFSARRLYGNSFTAYVSGTLTLEGNTVPKFSGMSKAMDTRLVVVPYPYSQQTDSVQDWDSIYTEEAPHLLYRLMQSRASRPRTGQRQWPTSWTAHRAATLNAMNATATGGVEALFVKTYDNQDSLPSPLAVKLAHQYMMDHADSKYVASSPNRIARLITSKFGSGKLVQAKQHNGDLKVADCRLVRVNVFTPSADDDFTVPDGALTAQGAADLWYRVVISPYIKMKSVAVADPNEDMIRLAEWDLTYSCRALGAEACQILTAMPDVQKVRGGKLPLGAEAAV